MVNSMNEQQRIEHYQKVMKAHAEHIENCLSGLDLAIHKQFELSEYIADPDYGHDERYIELAADVLNILQEIKH